MTRGIRRQISTAVSNSTEHLLRPQTRGRQEQDVLVHVGGHAIGQREERLHQPLIEEREREPGVVGLDAEPPVERLELQLHLHTAERAGDVVNQIARCDPQTGTRRPQRHDRAGERSPGAASSFVGGIHVLQIERVDVLPEAPVPDHVLGPLLRVPEHRERQPSRVQPEIERREIQTRVLTQEHQLTLPCAAPPVTHPRLTEGREGKEGKDEPLHRGRGRSLPRRP